VPSSDDVGIIKRKISHLLREAGAAIPPIWVLGVFELKKMNTMKIFPGSRISNFRKIFLERGGGGRVLAGNQGFPRGS
jgi:hypothetical protein